jgi:hypothetical protein
MELLISPTVLEAGRCSVDGPAAKEPRWRTRERRLRRVLAAESAFLNEWVITIPYRASGWIPGVWIDRRNAAVSSSTRAANSASTDLS